MRIRRSTATVLMVNLFGVLVALGLIELVLRTIYTPPALQSRLLMNRLMRQGPKQAEGLFDSARFHFEPNSTGQQLHNEYQYSVRHDRFGWRNPCFNFEQPSTAVLIGDSYTYGIGVSDNDLLQCQLKQLDPNLNVYALGLPGANIEQYLAILKYNSSTIRAVQPPQAKLDLVLCMGNDFEGLLAFAEPATEATTVQATPALKPSGWKAQLSAWNSQLMQQPWIADLHLLQLAKLAVLQNSRIKDHGDYFSNYGGQTFYKQGVPDPVQPLSTALKRLQSEFKAAGFELGRVIMIPDGAEVSPERLRRDAQLGGFKPEAVDIQHKFRSLLKACDQVGMRCVDLRPSVRGKDYYVFDGHFRPSGVAAVARSMVTELKQ